MKCNNCGKEIPHGSDFCPACGTKLTTTTKVFDTTEEVGERTVQLGKKVGKGALRVTGKAFSKIGDTAQKVGKKDKDKEK